MNNGFAGLLSIVEHVLGERPSEQIVLALISPEQKLAGTLVIQLDQDQIEEPDLGLKIPHILRIAQSLNAVDFEWFVTIAYTSKGADCEDHPSMFHQSQYIAGALEMILGREGAGAGLVTPEYFIDFTQDQTDEGTWEKHPVADIEVSDAAMMLIESGHSGAFRPPLEPSLATPERDAEIERLAAAFPPLVNWVPQSVEAAEARKLFETCLARDFGPTEPEAKALIAYLQHTGIRDRLIADVVTTIDDEETYMSVLAGSANLRMSMSRTDNALALFMNLTQYVDGEKRVPLLLCLSVVSWFRGSTHQALKYAELIQKIIPDDPTVREWMEKLLTAAVAKTSLRKPKP